MLARTTYRVDVSSRFGDSWSDIALPIVAPVAEDAIVKLDARGPDGLAGYVLTVERHIATDCLTLVRDTGRYRVLDDGTEVPLPAVRVPGADDEATSLSGGFLDALAFLTDATLTRSVGIGHRRHARA